MNHTLVQARAYHDSVTLMLLSGELCALEGIEEASAVMATDHNKEQLERVGLLTETARDAGPNDLVVVVRSDRPDAMTRVKEAIEAFLERRRATGGGPAYRPVSFEAAVREAPEANLLLVSIPGEHAAREAHKALDAGLHVMLFSDNVDLDDECRLKERARDLGLLVMGPDCGTAIINGAPLAFANMVPRGRVGIVGASGTGIQEISCCLAKGGAGISQAIGTGGRDLSEAVGGITMFQGLDALAEDDGTDVIVLVSKPPAPSVARRIIRRAAEIAKPVVVHFVSSPLDETPEGVWDSSTLEDAARKAAALSRGERPSEQEDIVLDEKVLETVGRLASSLGKERIHLRGLFSGGTLCDEAATICSRRLGRVFNNVSHDPATRLEDPLASKEHCVVDLGDDCFTRGRPHPMIDPGSRVERIATESADPSVAVILLDVVLGTGSHPNMAGALAPAITEAVGRGVVFVASVTGTDEDPQNLAEQTARLEEAGVLVLPSNAQAAEAAARIVSRGGRP